jgi:hypothetical protein
LIAELRRLESQKDQLLLERHEIEQFSEQPTRLPTPERIKELAHQAFTDLARDSAEFSRRMRQLIPQLEVFPYQLCDGSQPVLRAHVTLDLAPLIPQVRGLDGLGDLLRHDLIVDLFDPPQRAAYRRRILNLQAQGASTAEIAQALGLTTTAVLNALALDRRMRCLGLSDPYCLVTAPEQQTRFRRHKHPRFHFEPQDKDKLPAADPVADQDPHAA